jgi:hypothetical protein
MSDASILRGNYSQLVEWCRLAYAEGKSVHEVMQAIYGVDLPAEAYALHAAFYRLGDLQLEWFQEPAALLELGKPGATPAPQSPWSANQITNALKQNRNFLPLIQLAIGNASLDDHVIGYDLSELANGRTTVLGHSDEIEETGASFKVVGDSLLDVLDGWMKERLQLANEQYRSPSNRGTGALSVENIEEVAEQLKSIEKVKQELAASAGK